MLIFTCLLFPLYLAAKEIGFGYLGCLLALIRLLIIEKEYPKCFQECNIIVFIRTIILGSIIKLSIEIGYQNYFCRY